MNCIQMCCSDEQMENPEQPQLTEPPVASTSRSKVIRDTVVFQAKLFCDGIRDVFFSPVSIAAAVVGIIFSPSQPDYYLRKLMRFGHKTDRWLNLFGTYGRHPGSTLKTSDTYVKQVEEMMIKDYREGGVVNVVKEGTNKLVETAQREVKVVTSAINKPPKE